MNDEEQIIEHEIAMQDPAIRKDADAIRALLEPDFIEVITNGRIFDREGVIAALATQEGYVQPAVADLEATRLAPNVVLLTYTDERSIYHSSVWVQPSPDVWRMRFHQQTTIAL